MLDQDERHPGVGGECAEELSEGLQSARGCPDADDRKRWNASRTERSSWFLRTLCPSLLHRISPASYGQSEAPYQLSAKKAHRFLCAEPKAGGQQISGTKAPHFCSYSRSGCKIK